MTTAVFKRADRKSRSKVPWSGFLPRVLIVGGPDVDARLELIHSIKDTFEIQVLGSSRELNEKFSAHGFEYQSFRLSRRAAAASDVMALTELVRILRYLRPQVVHTFDTKPCVWGRIAARLAGVPIIVGTLPGLGSLYSSNNLSTRVFRSIYQPLQRLACQCSDLTIFQNRDDAHQFISAGVVSGQKAMVVPGSGVCTDLLVPGRVSDSQKNQLRAELAIRPDQIVVTMVSRVIRSKGVLEFMAASRVVSQFCRQVRFLLIGPEDPDSVDRLDLEQLNQLKQTVTWPGPSRDVPAILGISDIFVLPSAYKEGIPRVLLEAASMALPIVTTNSSGCNEVVEDGVNGFLVPVHDSHALSQAIIRLVVQPKLRRQFGLISRQRAVERFDLKLIAAQIRSVYQELLTQKGLLDARDLAERQPTALLSFKAHK
ncbi:MAG: hypothetical protein DMG06_05525 [Acidobacteria bacterium]|nr:MAG: hypothetical protein DMG06_05525 [Acidobacteriota bacterium]